jgi:capsular polysaccharide biosynthesis protein/Mrp family chromosome partitioning ATPase
VTEEARHTSSHESADEPDLLRDQLRQLLNYRWVIVFGVVLGLLGALGLGLLFRDSYSSTAEVTLRSATADPFAAGAAAAENQISIGTERQTAGSNSVAKAAARHLRYVDSIRDLQDGLEVTNPPDTLVLRFTYTADTPEKAARRANAFATAYLAQREQQTTSHIDTMLHRYLDQREPLLERQGKNDAIDDQLSVLNSRIAELKGIDTTPGTVVRTALPPRHSDGPGTVVLTILGAALGLGLGLLAAWVRLVFDPTVRSPGDVVRTLRAPVLGILPRVRGKYPDSLLAEGRLAEEYRSVAFRLAYDETFARRRRVMVVAPRGGIRTALEASVNLSAAFAEMGKDVLLLEADLRTPTLTDQLRHADGVRPGWARSPERGTAGWPTGRRVPIDAGESGFFDLVPGHRVRNVPRALTSQATTQLISQSDARSSVLVVLAPAVLSYADAIALTDRVDLVLLVCDPREVRREDLVRVRELVVGAGGVLLGAVLHSRSGGDSYGTGRQQLAEEDSRRVRHGTGAAEDVRTVRGRPGDETPSYRDVGADTIGLRVVDPADLEDQATRP